MSNNHAQAANPAESGYHKRRVLTVGVGGSAGALSSFTSILGTLGAHPGYALVYITHHDDAEAQRLRTILTAHSDLPVEVVQDGAPIRPNTIYIAPPERELAVFRSRFRLTPVSEDGRGTLIDSFFRSLAADQEHYAVGVLLSGAGYDGTEGLRSVRAAAGMTIAQEPETAEHDTMPTTAISAGVVDRVLPPEDVAEVIHGYARHVAADYPNRVEPSRQEEEQIDRVLAALHHEVGFDFSPYKRSTLYRRIVRRIGLHQLDGLESYERLVRSRRREAEALFEDLLIGVTSFFREPAAFEALRERAFPVLFAQANKDHYRIWVPGCAGGEEAYTLALLIDEYQRQEELSFSVQIFATDVNEEALEVARTGEYPRSIARDMAPERVNAYFDEIDGGYRVKEHIRERVLFARQDILRDPPFAHIDLISCRNLLIYFESGTQRALLPILAYSLRRNGVLFLGSSENVGARSELFTALDQEHKIFTRNPDVPAGSLRPPAFGGRLYGEGPQDVPSSVERQTLKRQIEVYLLTNRTPPAVFVDRKAAVVYIHGNTGTFLQPQSGYARMDITEMAREGLSVHLGQLLTEARREETQTTRRGIRFISEGREVTVDLTVDPLRSAGEDVEIYAVLFEQWSDQEVEESSTQVRREREQDDAEAPTAAYVRALEAELRSTKERLHTSVEELETTNEELKSSLEEYQSTNEELTSANQELRSAKARAQAAYREAADSSRELERRNEELRRAEAESLKLLETLDLPILILNHGGEILRFTTAATRLVHVQESDLGRDVRHLATRLGDKVLADALRRMGSKPQRIEASVESDEGTEYLMQLRPYEDGAGNPAGILVLFLPRW